MFQPITHLRPYQLEAVQRCVAWRKKRFVLEMPTGSGKTMTAIAAMRRLLREEQRAIFIADSIELVNQAYAAFLRYYDEGDIGLVWANTKQFGRWITIASKDTLLAGNTLERLLLAQGGQLFSLMFIDECHRACSEGYQEKIIPRLLSREGTLIGLSATPYRADGLNLRRVFPDDIAFSQDYFELVLQGYLANIESHDIETNLDLSSLVVEGEAYTNDEGKELPPFLLEQMQRSNKYECAYTAWMTYAREMRTLYFGQNVDDAYAFSRYIEAKGYTCPVVTSHTPKEDRTIEGVYYPGRDSIIRRFQTGELLFIANFDVYTTGKDIPPVQCIILGRLINARGLFTQICGRGTRLCPEISKEQCILLNLTAKSYVLCSMGFLIGHEASDIPSLKQALQEKLEEVLDDDEKEKLLQQHYDVSIVLTHLKTRAHNLFTGDGWQGDPLIGVYTKDCGEYGRLEAERSFTGFTMTHVYPSGIRRHLARTAVSMEHAMAIGQKELLVMQERSKMRDGTSARLTQPITPGQLRHLQNQRVPMPKDGKGMTQAHYMEIAQHLKTYKGAFTTEGGCIAFRQNTRTHKWEVQHWPYKGKSKKSSPLPHASQSNDEKVRAS